MEHALIHAGRQVDEKFAIISVCAAGQEVDQYQDAHTMDKNLNIWVALNRATDEELRSISKVIDYKYKKELLNKIYGTFTSQILEGNDLCIHYPEVTYVE